MAKSETHGTRRDATRYTTKMSPDPCSDTGDFEISGDITIREVVLPAGHDPGRIFVATGKGTGVDVSLDYKNHMVRLKQSAATWTIRVCDGIDIVFVRNRIKFAARDKQKRVVPVVDGAEPVLALFLADHPPLNNIEGLRTKPVPEMKTQPV